jgi:hypothetical protein
MKFNFDNVEQLVFNKKVTSMSFKTSNECMFEVSYLKY